jgi:hypothetical protein
MLLPYRHPTIKLFYSAVLAALVAKVENRFNGLGKRLLPLSVL